MASKARGLRGGGSPLYLHHPFAFLGHPSNNPVCSLPRWSCPRAWLVSQVRGPAVTQALGNCPRSGLTGEALSLVE